MYQKGILYDIRIFDRTANIYLFSLRYFRVCEYFTAWKQLVYTLKTL